MRYLLNDLHDLAWRLDDDSTYMKKRGEKEVLTSIKRGDTDLPASFKDALVENNAVTKSQYDAY